VIAREALGSLEAPNGRFITLASRYPPRLTFGRGPA
jgi:hypothetical protein